EQSRRVHLDDDTVVEVRRWAARRDALGEASNDAGLSDTARTHQARTVAVPLGEHVERAFNLGLAPEDGIELAARSGERQVSTEGGEKREAPRVELEALRACG